LPERDLALLIEAAAEAAAIAMRYWRSEQSVWHKAGGAGPVSEADFAVDAYLRERLGKARPDYGWLSEETEDGTARLSARRVFVVDPIDGTRAFVAHERTWALSLAVVEDGAAIAGVVQLPAMGRLYTASRGAGARLDGKPISVTEGRGRLDGARVLASRSVLEPELWRHGVVPPFRREFRPSLAYRMCLVAEGRHDAMLTHRPAWEWDIAAGTVIAREAGAVVTDRHGAPLRFNTPEARADGVIAGPPATHAALLRALAP
jgi:myo-inositol-1(or 4)-monophosphatase